MEYTELIGAVEKLIDIGIVSLSIQIAFFAYFIFSKWSKK